MIARIIMSEHPDEKDLKLFTSDHKDAVKGGFLQTPNLAFLFKLVLLHYWLFQDMKIKSLQIRT